MLTDGEFTGHSGVTGNGVLLCRLMTTHTHTHTHKSYGEEGRKNGGKQLKARPERWLRWKGRKMSENTKIGWPRGNNRGKEREGRKGEACSFPYPAVLTSLPC